MYENPGNLLVYAGTSASNLKIVYSDAWDFVLPSGTKYVRLKTIKDKAPVIEEISLK